mgnify:CR=1 FL=1
MKKTRLNVLCGMGLALCLSSQAVEETSVIFRVGFDAYTVRADVAGGAAESPDLSEGLMLRMHDGRGKKGNAVYLNGGERIRYQGRGNICPQRGSISFWVAPMGWKASVKGPRPFVTFEMPRFRLTVGKISAPTGFGIECAWDDAPTVSKREMANALLTDAEWEDGRWHRFDAVWSEKGLKFFVDGVARRASDIHGYLRTCSDVAFARRWNDLPQEEYFKLKNEFAKKMLKSLKDKTGIDLVGHIEEMEVASPWTFARYLGVPEGSVYGYMTSDWDGMMARMQMLGTDYPIKGLRPIGAAGPRGDGYSAAMICGQLMAASAIKELNAEEGGNK